MCDYQLARYDMIWSVMLWYGTVHVMVWYVMVWCIVCYGMVYSMLWYGICYGVEWYGMVLCVMLILLCMGW